MSTGFETLNRFLEGVDTPPGFDPVNVIGKTLGLLVESVECKAQAARDQKPLELAVLRVILTKFQDDLIGTFTNDVDHALESIVLDDQSPDELMSYLRGHAGYWRHLRDGWDRFRCRLASGIPTQLRANRLGPINSRPAAERRLSNLTTILRQLELSDIFPDSFIAEMNAVSANHTGITREELLSAIRTQLDGIENSWRRGDADDTVRLQTGESRQDS